MDEFARAAFREREARQVVKRRAFLVHLSVYIATNVFLFVVWLLVGGRGFGKTRAGAEWIRARAREAADARVALVGGSRDDVVKVMIEGPSGLIRVAAAVIRDRGYSEVDPAKPWESWVEIRGR